MFDTYSVAADASGPIAAAQPPGYERQIENICVYCGSSAGADPAFAAAGRYLGRAMARAGIGLVYGGGGGDGLMGTIARAALSAGGHVTAIIPAFLKAREEMLEGTQELIVVEDMHVRKRMMFDRADAFVALPGGIGTLEELVEQMTWRQLDRHNKPVVIADINGFWQPLLALLGHMGETGFVRSDFSANYRVSRSVADILPMLCGARNPAPCGVAREAPTAAFFDALDDLENSSRHDAY